MPANTTIVGLRARPGHGRIRRHDLRLGRRPDLVRLVPEVIGVASRGGLWTSILNLAFR